MSTYFVLAATNRCSNDNDSPQPEDCRANPCEIRYGKASRSYFCTRSTDSCFGASTQLLKSESVEVQICCCGTCCSPCAVCQTNTTHRNPRRIFVTHLCSKLLGTSLQSWLFAEISRHLVISRHLRPLPVVNMLCPPHLQPAWPVRTVAGLLHTWWHSLFQSRRL